MGVTNTFRDLTSSFWCSAHCSVERSIFEYPEMHTGSKGKGDEGHAVEVQELLHDVEVQALLVSCAASILCS